MKTTYSYSISGNIDKKMIVMKEILDTGYITNRVECRNFLDGVKWLYTSDEEFVKYLNNRLKDNLVLESIYETTIYDDAMEWKNALSEKEQEYVQLLINMSRPQAIIG